MGGASKKVYQEMLPESPTNPTRPSEEPFTDEDSLIFLQGDSHTTPIRIPQSMGMVWAACGKGPGEIPNREEDLFIVHPSSFTPFQPPISRKRCRPVRGVSVVSQDGDALVAPVVFQKGQAIRRYIARSRIQIGLPLREIT